MKMKNVFMLLLGAMLILSMVSMVSAEPTKVSVTNESINSKNKVDVTVTLALSQSFEVEIPADIVLNDDLTAGVYTGYSWLNATVHLLNDKTRLTVDITSENVDNHQAGNKNYWNLTSAGAPDLQYIIAATNGPNVHIDEAQYSNWVYEGMTPSVISLEDPTTKNVCLHFKLASPLTAATVGTYTDTLTFTVNLLPIA